MYALISEYILIIVRCLQKYHVFYVGELKVLATLDKSSARSILILIIIEDTDTVTSLNMYTVILR